MYDMHILFFDKYTCILTYSILVHTYPQTPAHVPMWFGGDGDDASRRGMDQQVSQQPDQVEMAKVIRLECCLKAVVSQRVRQAKHAGVQYENI